MSGLGFISGGFFDCLLEDSSAEPFTKCSPASLGSCLVNLSAIFFTFPGVVSELEVPPTGEVEFLSMDLGGISGFGLISGLRGEIGRSRTDIVAGGGGFSSFREASERLGW